MPNSNIVNAKGAGLVSGVGQNSPNVRNMQDYNGFDRSQTFFQTQRFAEVNPTFAKKFIAGDRIPLRHRHQLRSFTLESPLMSNVYLHRASYNVPLQCIYHNTFEYWFKNPVRGNDIPEDAKAGFSLSHINSSRLSAVLYLNTRKVDLSDSQSSASSVLWLNNLFLLMQIYSRDGLLQKLGYSVSSNAIERIYQIFGNIMAGSFNVRCSISFEDAEGTSYLWDLPARTMIIGGSRTIDLTLSQERFYFYELVNNKYNITAFFFNGFESGVDESFIDAFNDALSDIPVFQDDDIINLEKVFAYQYVCAQFYSNSFVDDIYSARQWEENNLSLLKDAIRSYSSVSAIQQLSTVFQLNGKVIGYDLISYHIFEILFRCFASAVGANTPPVAFKNICCKILRNIFEVHYSLRTSDFFTDSRTQPLAVGDVYAAVTNQGVSAIDVNKSLWIQRLLNAVNRIPQHIETYLKQMFGFEPQSKEPKPMFIAKERFLIIGQEIENTTSTDQGNVVTNLRSSDSGRFSFETFASEPCIVISVSSYSMEYAYAQSYDKEFKEFDRLDNFNPYFQHVGDQPILSREIYNDPNRFSLDEVFGYQLRYYQYKKSINHASGGFIDDLPSWISLFDKIKSADSSHLSSEFIRNHNIDFDDFYSSLTGFDPCQYFHFIVRFDTQCHVTSKQQKYPSLV